MSVVLCFVDLASCLVQGEVEQTALGKADPDFPHQRGQVQDHHQQCAAGEEQSCRAQFVTRCQIYHTLLKDISFTFMDAIFKIL